MAPSCILAHVRRVVEQGCALSTLLALLALVPLAQASPPDPTWIHGIYDEADGDDVVALIDDTVASREGTVYGGPAPVRLSEEVTLLVPTVYGTTCLAIRERGPPSPVIGGLSASPTVVQQHSSFIRISSPQVLVLHAPILAHAHTLWAYATQCKTFTST